MIAFFVALALLLVGYLTYGKFRVVFIGDKIINAVREYKKVRPDTGCSYLFVSRRGGQLTRGQVNRVFNGCFMPGELATLLSGRYVELKMLPLSFREFCSGLRSGAAQTNAQKFDAYLRMSSFPYALRLPGTGGRCRSI